MIARAELERLYVKYELLHRLRSEREAAIARGLLEFPEDEKLPRRRLMRSLASEFPGVLRELDDSDAAFVADRLTAIRAALDGAEIVRWMEAAVVFHRALREALLMRAGRPSGTFWSDPVRASFAARIEAPESGRLLDVVWLAVAEVLATTPREAELLVYPNAPARGVRV